MKLTFMEKHLLTGLLTHRIKLMSDLVELHRSLGKTDSIYYVPFERGLATAQSALEKIEGIEVE